MSLYYVCILIFIIYHLSFEMVWIFKSASFKHLLTALTWDSYTCHLKEEAYYFFPALGLSQGIFAAQLKQREKGESKEK